jgi:hypothetical protein
MNWFDVVKQPKLRTSSKITTRLGSESKPEEDDNCKRKLREYEIKISRMQDKERGLNAYTLVMDRFKDIPEEVACKALKILNGLKLQETNDGEHLHDYRVTEPFNKEQMVIGGKRYGIKAIYAYMQKTVSGKDPPDVYMSMQLKISIESSLGYLRTVLNFTVRFLGTKEEAMKKVDFR